jgi:hypothetical protein
MPWLQATLSRMAIRGKFDRHAPLAQSRAQPQGNVGRVFHQQNSGCHKNA